MWGVRADCGTLMGRQYENEKEEKKKNKPSYINRIATLLYSTFERVPVVFYYANPY